VHGDVMGNSYAVVNGGGGPTILLAGHVDEIGLIVTYVDDSGYVYVGPDRRAGTRRCSSVSASASSGRDGRRGRRRRQEARSTS
jgi:hypothetical protein